MTVREHKAAYDWQPEDEPEEPEDGDKWRALATARLLINEHPITFLPTLAKIAGGADEAIILQQIHYWSGNNQKKDTSKTFKEGYSWTYNTLEEWLEQFPWMSRATLQRKLVALREQGFLVAKPLSNNPFDKTMWYRINYQELYKISNQAPTLSN